MSITMIGLDTAKSVFQIHAVNETGKTEMKRKLSRNDLIPFFKKQELCTVVLEACGAAHHWARILTGLGHDVKLIAPEAVKPFVKKGKKNDAADAAALCEAASRPDIKFVPMKTTEQQAILALHSARSLLVKQQTMLANAMRGLATEFGLTVPKGISKLEELTVLVDTDETFPVKARQAFTGLFDQCEALTESIVTFEAAIVAHARHDETARRLATSAADAFRHIGSLRDPIPGIGPITALTLAIEIDPEAFESGRHLAAWAGLTPKEHSTGGKQRMGGISRAGHERLRVLLVAGATSVINAAMRPGSKLMTEWLRALLQRKPRKVVAVALANKMARVAWVLMTRGEVYRRPAAATGAAVA
jgi:error-prone DNA polymerase